MATRVPTSGPSSSPASTSPELFRVVVIATLSIFSLLCCCWTVYWRSNRRHYMATHSRVVVTEATVELINCSNVDAMIEVVEEGQRGDGCEPVARACGTGPKHDEGGPYGYRIHIAQVVAMDEYERDEAPTSQSYCSNQ